ncbi:MAG: hypothetical protein JRI96_04360 [Deltaproteobacteria bacterium]|nr:hypothetical protein [Deltaproteobacteria bacterium]
MKVVGCVMKDEEFARLLNFVRNEIIRAINSFYTYIEIHNQLASNKALYRKLNRNPSFWNIVLHSLQNTFFITLGRIFDDKSENSVHKLVGVCLANPHLFSKESLARRRMKAGKRPQWLDGFLLTAFEPSGEDLRVFRRQVSRLRKIYNAVYGEIRNKVIAHSEFSDSNRVSQLFSKTQVGKIDELLYGLHDVVSVLWELLDNGKRPEFGVQVYDYKDHISKTVGDVLSAFR